MKEYEVEFFDIKGNKIEVADKEARERANSCLTKTEADALYEPLGGGGGTVYATKEYVDNTFATKTELNAKADASVLDDYATKTELNSKADASALNNYATKTELNSKADASALNDYVTLDEFQTETDALADDIEGINNKLDGNIVSGLLSANAVTFSANEVKTITFNTYTIPTGYKLLCVVTPRTNNNNVTFTGINAVGLSGNQLTPKLNFKNTYNGNLTNVVANAYAIIVKE